MRIFIDPHTVFSFFFEFIYNRKKKKKLRELDSGRKKYKTAKTKM